MTTYTVRDRGTTLEFEGVLLASSSSKSGAKTRWIDLELYRTAAGSFVLAGVGRSSVPGESDRPWAQVSEEAAGVVERLTMYDDDGVRYLPHTNERLLQAAAAKDERIRAAFRHQRIA